MSFWVLTSFFNPAKFNSLLKNYHIFKEKLNSQGVNLLTIELAFNQDEFNLPPDKYTVQLRGSSVMWQKERLLNHGLSLLPDDCDKFAWIDCDVLFSTDQWADMASDALDQNDIIQLYKRIFYLPKGDLEYKGTHTTMLQGLVWQKIIHKNWLERRRKKELPFSAPGFAWAAKRSVFSDIGIYDKNIIGSGDTFLVDCYFDSWEIHGYAKKFTDAMKVDMMEWKDKLDQKNPSIGYIPVDIYHLYHGSLKDRRYMDRHEAILQNSYDPKTDIILKDGIFEWGSEKPMMHETIRQYFFNRKEDE